MSIQALMVELNPQQLIPLVALYIGPESILPLTSALAAVVGVLLIVWQRVTSLGRKLWRFLTRR